MALAINHCMTRLLLMMMLGCIISLVPAPQASGQSEGVWEVLDQCRLVPSGINDGDSFLVEHAGEEHVFRLYFVDTPETYDTYMDRIRDQARYFQIETDQVIATGKEASAFTEKFLQGRFRVITKWTDARGGQSAKRYYALVLKDGDYLNHALVEAGLARIYGMPTRERWPGGETPEQFLRHLKQAERNAQRGQKGIWALNNNPQQNFFANTQSERNGNVPTANITAVPIDQAINLNTATQSELESLPGIGPSYAQRIIEARPIENFEALTKIPGISSSTLEKIRPLSIIRKPPPPEKSAAYYLASLEEYLNKEVTVEVLSLATSEVAAPDGFQTVVMETGPAGGNGGQIIAFIPTEFYDSFLNYYAIPGKDFSGILYQRNGETVLVYPRQ